MGGRDGVSATRVADLGQTPEQKLLATQSKTRASGGVQDLLASYGSGKMSLQDALQQAKAQGGAAGEGGQAAIQEALASDPASAQRYASEQVQNDAIMGKMFGKGGLQEQVMGKEGQLGSNLDESRAALSGKGDSYGLQDSDLKALGQASDNIARQSGQQEASLTQALSDRGLGMAGSGAAGASFSGLQGNKMEALAQSQQSIAQARVNTAKDLANQRMQSDLQRAQQAASIGAQGTQATQNARNQNLNAQGQRYDQTKGGAELGLEGQAMAQSQNNAEFQQREATKEDDLGASLMKAGQQGLSGFAKTVSNPLNLAKALAPLP